MRSLLRSSPRGAPRSIVSNLSMPRPAYIAAHRPAGPAPTMITSYPLEALSVIQSSVPSSVRSTQLQSRRLGVAGERLLEPLAKPNRVHLHIGPLRARQLLQRRPADRRDAVAVSTLPMQQRPPPPGQPPPDPGPR